MAQPIRVLVQHPRDRDGKGDQAHRDGRQKEKDAALSGMGVEEKARWELILASLTCKLEFLSYVRLTLRISRDL